jgi:alkanesulfonate monooxygenase
MNDVRPPCEVSWFAALCDDDYEFLGVPDPRLQSSFEHCRDIVMQAETGGFDNICAPSAISWASTPPPSSPAWRR